MSERITRTPGVCGGKPCIAGHRIRVSDVAVWHDQMGMTADEIVSEYPGLGLSDVHAALAYYYDHIEEIRQEISEEATAVAAARCGTESLLESRLARIKHIS